MIDIRKELNERFEEGTEKEMELLLKEIKEKNLWTNQTEDHNSPFSQLVTKQVASFKKHYTTLLTSLHALIPNPTIIQQLNEIFIAP